MPFNLRLSSSAGGGFESASPFPSRFLDRSNEQPSHDRSRRVLPIDSRNASRGRIPDKTAVFQQIGKPFSGIFGQKPADRRSAILTRPEKIIDMNRFSKHFS